MADAARAEVSPMSKVSVHMVPVSQPILRLLPTVTHGPATGRAAAQAALPTGTL